MRILFLSFYFEPDHGPASIRNTLIAKALAKHESVDKIDVITTFPNRWTTPLKQKKSLEKTDKLSVYRIDVGSYKYGLKGELMKFWNYQRAAVKTAKNNSYDLVYASSSKLGTAALGAYISDRKRSFYYLDIRDLFIDTIRDYFPGKIFKPFIFILSKIYRYSIIRADKINVLSNAFTAEIAQINPNAKISAIPYGVDTQFYDRSAEMPDGLIENSTKKNPACKKIVYAGNIGFAQSLEIIIPKISGILPSGWELDIYGNGPAKDKLYRESSRLKNINLYDTVNRDDIPDIYNKADVLFLHLNDKSAFEKSLPSKLFEYCCMGKPILAGYKGLLPNFVAENEIEGIFMFEPNNKESFLETFYQIRQNYYDRRKFIDMWKREDQIKLMVNDIISRAPDDD